MSRAPYVADGSGQDEPELVASIRARRGGKLLNLDRMLLNSPAFAHGWNTHLGAVRGELSVSLRLRELVICAVAVLNGADYELAHHAPELLRCGGTARQVEALKALDLESDVFDPTELAVLRLTSEMTRNVRVSDRTFADVRSKLGDERQVVELVGVIATYNMVSRFLVALEVDPEDP
ncbi:MAG TPA: carboxymuconolactone decarboxylase family protein [Steroidobacteraceae bacterium]